MQYIHIIETIKIYFYINYFKHKISIFLNKFKLFGFEFEDGFGK